MSFHANVQVLQVRSRTNLTKLGYTTKLSLDHGLAIAGWNMVCLLKSMRVMLERKAGILLAPARYVSIFSVNVDE